MGDIRRVFVLLLLVTLCHNVICQVPFPEKCPDVKVVETFDLDRYMGIWYEYSKYPFFWEAGQKCQHAIYKNNGNDTVSVKNTGTFVVINITHSVEGTAKVMGIGKLAVAFKNQVVTTPNYLILGTDYENWVVVYSCREISSLAHTKVIWILTRQRIPSEESITAAMDVIKSNKLNVEFLIKSSQTDCPAVVTDADGDQDAAASSNQEQPINNIGLSSSAASDALETV